VEENGGDAAEIGNGEGDRMRAAAAKDGEEMKPWDVEEREPVPLGLKIWLHGSMTRRLARTGSPSGPNNQRGK
jgi:hypothetical protein